MKLNTPEEREKGSVTKETFNVFVQAMGGYFVVIVILVLAFVGQASVMYSFNFLEEWGHKFDTAKKYEELRTYSAISLAYCFLVVMLSIFIGMIGYKLSVTMHSKMTFSLLHCEMEKFLDRIPIGRIINKFSKDIDIVDKNIYSDFAFFLRSLMYSVSLLATICYVVGIEMLALILIWLIITIKIQNKVMTTKRELKRCQSVQNSPMVNYYMDIIKGLTVMRNTDSQEDKQNGNTLFNWMREKYVS